MKITTDHAASSYGQPVILDNAGDVLDYATGIKAVRKALGMSTTEFGQAVGKSRRAVEDWEQGRHMPPASALFVLSGLLGRVGQPS